MNNYFELFQLPVKLPVDVSQLNQQYRQLQRQYHPDNFSLSTDAEKREMIQKSALINDGYVTLKNPIKAAEYLLTLQGISISAEKNIIYDNDFLEEQFELREKLDDIESQSDFAQLDGFYSDIEQQKTAKYHQLLDDIVKQDWPSAQQQIYKIRYLVKLIEQIEKLQEKQDAL